MGWPLRFCSFIFVGKMCIFVSRRMKIVTFIGKNCETAKRVVDFPLERDTFREKKHGNRWGSHRTKLQQQQLTLEIVEDFACEAKKPEKSLFSFFKEIFSSFFFKFLHFSSVFFIVPQISFIFSSFFHISQTKKKLFFFFRDKRAGFWRSCFFGPPPVGPWNPGCSALRNPHLRRRGAQDGSGSNPPNWIPLCRKILVNMLHPSRADANVSDAVSLPCPTCSCEGAAMSGPPRSGYGVGGLLENHRTCRDCRDSWSVWVGLPMYVNVQVHAVW